MFIPVPILMLGPSINGRKYKVMLSRLCFSNTKTKPRQHNFVLQSTSAYKIDSEQIRDYTKLFWVCKVEIKVDTVNKIEVLSSF